MDKYEIIYSKRVMNELVKKGFFPVQTLPNPTNVKYKCWVFKNTTEFSEVLHTLLSSIGQKE